MLKRRNGFTLMELMLVVVIIAITTGIAVPRFMQSFRGAKLRGSMRTVMMVHRFARSTAVLKQQHMAILFDQAKNQLTLISAGASQSSSPQGFLDEESSSYKEEPEETDGDEDDENVSDDTPVSVSEKMERDLMDDVKILSFESGAEGQEHEGIFWVNYYPNGMCDPYRITLEDDRMKQAILTVDSISGKVEISYE